MILCDKANRVPPGMKPQRTLMQVPHLKELDLAKEFNFGQLVRYFQVHFSVPVERNSLHDQLVCSFKGFAYGPGKQRSLKLCSVSTDCANIRAIANYGQHNRGTCSGRHE